MRLAIAGAYVLAGGLHLAGWLTRADPRVRRRAGGAAPERSALARLGGHVRMARARSELQAKIETAGVAADIDEVMGWKVALGMAGLLAGASTGDPLLGPVASVALGAAGFRSPDFYLARRARDRRRHADRSVTDVIDLVAVAVSAGTSPRLALDRVPDSIRGPLREDLLRARREVELGGSWREAIRDVAHRCGSRDLGRLAITLDRAERLGTPVAARLRDLAREVRAERFARQEERARRAPVQMLFPLVFLILPAFVLAAVIPAVLVSTRGLA